MSRFALLVMAIVLYAVLFAPPARSAETEQPVLIYSSWTKFCLKRPNDEQVCFTGIEGRIEASAIPWVSAILIESEDQTKRLLRITLPLGVELEPGTRLIVDRRGPVGGAHVPC